MRNVLLACMSLLFCVSCETLTTNDEAKVGQSDCKVVIEDYVVGYDYEVLTVDGQPALRVKHGSIVTRVPYVVVDSGVHTFGIQKRKKQAGESSGAIHYVKAQICVGRRYFFNELDGHYRLASKDGRQ